MRFYTEKEAERLAQSQEKIEQNEKDLQNTVESSK